MVPSVQRMWLSSVVSCTLFAMVMSAGNEYLPPNKGYNYDKPSISFPPNIPNGNKITPPPNVRPPITKPPTQYLPQPTPGNGGSHDHSEEHHHEHHGGEHDHHHEPGMPFDFSYKVVEDGNDYSHNAISDGDITRGEYRVALPDGRTQIVKYTADWKNGFNAEVTYEGEAKYPDAPAGGYGSGPSGNSFGPGPSTGPGQAYVPPSQGSQGYQY